MNDFIDTAIHRKVYINPETNKPWLEGDLIYNLELADTLEKLAESSDFVHEFYGGGIGKELVSKIKGLGGTLTLEDLAGYTPLWKTPTQWRMQDSYDVYSAGQFASFSPI